MPRILKWQAQEETSESSFFASKLIQLDKQAAEYGGLDE